MIAIELPPQEPDANGIELACTVRISSATSAAIEMRIKNAGSRTLRTLPPQALTFLHVEDGVRYVVHGVTSSPSLDELHLGHFPPTEYSLVAPGEILVVYGGFQLKVDSDGVRSVLGTEVTLSDTLPLACRSAYWLVNDSDPPRRESAHHVVSSSVLFRAEAWSRE